MPAGPRDSQYPTLPPPGFTDVNVTLKRGQLIELLQKIIDKCRHEPQFLAQQPKETDLLVSIAQFTLLSTPMSSDEKRDFLNNIMNIGQDLLTDENNTEIVSLVDSCSPTNENQVSTSIALPSDTTNNDPDGGFTLDDLASEYLQNEPTPSSSNDKPTTSSESEEPDLSLDDLSKNYLSSPPSTPSTSVLSTIVFPPLSNEPIITTSPLESILYSNRLSSHDAADDADCIWKKESSPFGQMFCTKSNEIQTITVKRISTCLLDRSLYERLTRLIALLPKQCIRNSVQQLSIRHNDQQSHRPQRSNNEYRRPTHRPSFQQNSLQSYPMQRHPTNQNPRQYSNASYSNQQGNFNGYFVDRRSQQQNRYPPPPFAPYPPDQQQQQNRYPPPPFAPYSPDQQQQQQNRYPPDQQKGPAKNNSYNNNNQQQQKKKPQTNNQQASNQHQQQRGPKKGPGGGGGGNKFNNEKTGAPGSGPNSNPK